jgi:hypothetical protein
VNIGTADAPILVPVAFFAVVSIGVIGLYVAFAIPIFLRWKAGDSFHPGGWTLVAPVREELVQGPEDDCRSAGGHDRRR